MATVLFVDTVRARADGHCVDDIRYSGDVK
jgi:hypothetical protein